MLWVLPVIMHSYMIPIKLCKKKKVNVFGFPGGHAKLKDPSLNFAKEKVKKVNVTGFVRDHASLKNPCLNLVQQKVNVTGLAYDHGVGLWLHL